MKSDALYEPLKYEHGSGNKINRNITLKFERQLDLLTAYARGPGY